MNTSRIQRPYRFRPPKYSPLLAAVLLKTANVFALRKRLKVRKIRVDGVEAVAKLVRAGQSVLVAPNHGEHADAFALCHIGSKHGLRFHFMAAREGFEQNRWLNSFALQRLGAFSVDRDGHDLAAVKTAVKILRDCKYPLVIFPEGEIYHHSELLAPLNDGVATIALRAAGKLPHGKESYVVPTAIRFWYSDEMADTFSPRLARLEERINWKPRQDIETVERIYRLGSGILAIKEVEFLGHGQPGSIVERIRNLQNRLLEAVERKHGREGNGSIPQRVRSLRGQIRRVLINPPVAIPKEQEEALYDDLDTLYLVVQLYSYPGQYLRENPTIHRIAETILKLEEDVLGAGTYPAARDVHVRFGEPIWVKQFLAAGGLDARTGVRPLTDLLTERIQSMIEGMAQGDGDPC